MKLRKMNDVKLFIETIDKCENDVWLYGPDGSKYNMKSFLSQYVAIASLIGDYGDEMELYTATKEDEDLFIKLFRDHPEMISNKTVD